jgi:hypothetical protein
MYLIVLTKMQKYIELHGFYAELLKIKNAVQLLYEPQQWAMLDYVGRR